MILQTNQQFDLTDITKSQVGLPDVDNTSDADKPISLLALQEFDTKLDVLTHGKNIIATSGSTITINGSSATGYDMIMLISTMLDNLRALVQAIDYRVPSDVTAAINSVAAIVPSGGKYIVVIGNRTFENNIIIDMSSDPVGSTDIISAEIVNGYIIDISSMYSEIFTHYLPILDFGIGFYPDGKIAVSVYINDAINIVSAARRISTLQLANAIAIKDELNKEFSSISASIINTLIVGIQDYSQYEYCGVSVLSRGVAYSLYPYTVSIDGNIITSAPSITNINGNIYSLGTGFSLDLTDLMIDSSSGAIYESDVAIYIDSISSAITDINENISHFDTVIDDISSFTLRLPTEHNKQNMSTSELLTSIKTVDGTGSGLDADLLQGESIVNFTTSYNTAKGV